MEIIVFEWQFTFRLKNLLKSRQCVIYSSVFFHLEEKILAQGIKWTLHFVILLLFHILHFQDIRSFFSLDLAICRFVIFNYFIINCASIEQYEHLGNHSKNPILIFIFCIIWWGLREK